MTWVVVVVVSVSVVAIVVVVVAAMVPARIGKRDKNVVAKTSRNIVAMHQQQRTTVAASLAVFALKFKRPSSNLGTIYFW